MSNKLIGRMLAAQVLSAMTVSLCLLIDNIMINRFLGMEAIAAYELANPVLLIIGALASVLSAGVQVACSKSLGEGSQEETNRGYSTAVAIMLAVSLPFTVFVLLLRGPLASAMGAGSSPGLFSMTKDYLAGFVIGAPATMAALILVPFLQMAGKSGLLIAAVLGMTVSDVAFDLLNVLVFHGGMFGMGLASSLSYYVALLTALFYFLSRKCAFRFSRRLISRKKAAELFRGGFPSAFTMVSGVLMVFFMNRLLMRTGGAEAVAAYAVISGILNVSNSVSTGMNGVTLTLSGILYSEEDRNGLRRLLSALPKFGALLGLAASALFFVLAPACVSLFLPDEGTTRTMAILGVRLTSLGLFPCCLVNVAKSFYQGTGRVPQMEALSVLEGVVLPAACAWLAGLALGVSGIWLFFVLGEVLTLVCVFLYGWGQYRQGKNPILQDSFGVPPENVLEAELPDLPQVVTFSRQAEDFCLDRGGSSLFAHRIALCIEETAGNIVTHGFRPDGNSHLSVRLQRKPGLWILRFRDDCRAFDPVHYVPPEGAENGLGLRLVLGMADEARYTWSLNLNNLTILLREAPSAEE